ncbi:DUF6268 family outer membrane beta-barrel protein [Flavobacterium sp. JP2137]|uniref:DUF6268 family outer membrane beta-barrel protein n=1 Tax=Flavobacterium sp. JP2137 TaxID=3414510 RepID=UPI003D2FADF9
MQRALICIGVILWVVSAQAQQYDSLTQKMKRALADKFPSTRILNVEYKQLAPYKTTLETKDGQQVQDYKIKSFEQLRFDANIPLVKRPQWVWSASVHYQYTSFDGQLENQQPGRLNSFSGDFHYHSSGLNLTHFRRLFNKPAIFNASVHVDGSEQHFERVRGLLTGVVVLKHTAETTISLGVLAILEPSVELPILPVFSYERRFENQWTLDITLPQKVMLRKQLFDHSRISMGSQLNKTSFYSYDQPSGTHEFRQLEINSGITYERTFGHALIATIKTGMQNTFNARIFEKEKSFKNYAVENSPKPSFYLSAGISYNPFAKK